MEACWCVQRVTPCCAVQGAEKDLQSAVSQEQDSQQKQQYQKDLTLLMRRAATATQQAVAEAQRMQQQSRTVAGSCVIEEVGDDPEEELQVCRHKCIKCLKGGCWLFFLSCIHTTQCMPGDPQAKEGRLLKCSGLKSTNTGSCGRVSL